MKAAIKAAPVKNITRGALAEDIAQKTELTREVCLAVLQNLAEVAEREVKKTGKFTTPGMDPWPDIPAGAA